MLLVFRRTDDRRYAVVAKRAELPDVEMDPAPGHNELVPLVVSYIRDVVAID